MIVLWLVWLGIGFRWALYRIMTQISSPADEQGDDGDDHQHQIMEVDDAILDRTERPLHPHFPGLGCSYHALSPGEWCRRKAETEPRHDRQQPLYHPHRLTTPARQNAVRRG